MKADKTLSIKVKSKTERRIMENPEVEMITEWNIKRITSAIIVLLIFIIIPAYYFSHLEDTHDSLKDEKNTSIKATDPVSNEDNIPQNSKQDALPEDTIALTSNEEVVLEESVTQNSIKDSIPEPALAEPPIALAPPVKSTEQVDKEIKTKIVDVKEVDQQLVSKMPSSETEYMNSHITLAQLAQGVNDRKPYGEVKLPLLVDNAKATGVFFFTEVNNMRGSTVFHEWLREGESIFKLKAIISSNRSRFYTSKLFTPSSVGQWQVRIITEQGEVLHKIDFSVENR